MKMSVGHSSRKARIATPDEGRIPSLRAQVGQVRCPGPRLGVVQSFRIGEHAVVDDVLANLATLGVTDLRTPISWAELQTMEGEQWYKWLIPRLAEQMNVVPCVLCTPPSQAILPRTSAPPRDPKAYADF